MAPGTIATRRWIMPDAATQTLWSALYTRCRSIPGAETSLTVTDEQIVEAVARAVEQVQAKTYKHEVWTAGPFTSRTEYLTLPWDPTGIVSCRWSYPASPDGERIQDWLYDVQGSRWTFLGSTSDWPTGSVTITLDVLGRPMTAAQLPGDLYLSVRSDLLWPLIEAEVSSVLQRLDGVPPGQIMLNLQAQRNAQLAMLFPLVPQAMSPSMQVRAYPRMIVEDKKK